MRREDFDYAPYTNFPDWYAAAELEGSNIALWSLFHERYYQIQELQAMPWWQTADQIFLVGQEADAVDYTSLDQRIQVWDSVHQPNDPRHHTYYWWWWQTQDVNSALNSIDRLTDPLCYPPQQVFECLMGSGKPHRQYIHDKMQFMPDLTDMMLYNFAVHSKSWVPACDEDQPERVKNYANAWQYHSSLAGLMVSYRSLQTSNISTFLPWQVYNKCWFSVVTETSDWQRFLTEKTAKALLGKRLFVMIGAPGILAELHRLGFQTFGDVIDESYDAVADHHRRWDLALEQARSICMQDPVSIYKKIQPVLEHNQRRFLEIDWHEILISGLKQARGA